MLVAWRAARGRRAQLGSPRRSTRRSTTTPATQVAARTASAIERFARQAPVHQSCPSPAWTAPLTRVLATGCCRHQRATAFRIAKSQAASRAPQRRPRETRMLSARSRLCRTPAMARKTVAAPWPGACCHGEGLHHSQTEMAPLGRRRSAQSHKQSPSRSQRRSPSRSQMLPEPLAAAAATGTSDLEAAQTTPPRTTPTSSAPRARARSRRGGRARALRRRLAWSRREAYRWTRRSQRPRRFLMDPR